MSHSDILSELDEEEAVSDAEDDDEDSLKDRSSS